MRCIDSKRQLVCRNSRSVADQAIAFFLPAQLSLSEHRLLVGVAHTGSLVAATRAAFSLAATVPAAAAHDVSRLPQDPAASRVLASPRDPFFHLPSAARAPHQFSAAVYRRTTGCSHLCPKKLLLGFFQHLLFPPRRVPGARAGLDTVTVELTVKTSVSKPYHHSEIQFSHQLLTDAVLSSVKPCYARPPRGVTQSSPRA